MTTVSKQYFQNPYHRGQGNILGHNAKRRYHQNNKATLADGSIRYGCISPKSIVVLGLKGPCYLTLAKKSFTLSLCTIPSLKV